MTQPKFTPGPWVNGAHGITAIGRGVVARCPTPKDGGVMEFLANGRLITAAPDLFEALQDWLGFAEEKYSEFDIDVCDSEKLCPKCEAAGCINQKIRLARAALAKAGA